LPAFLFAGICNLQLSLLVE